MAAFPYTKKRIDERAKECMDKRTHDRADESGRMHGRVHGRAGIYLTGKQINKRFEYNQIIG